MNESKVRIKYKTFKLDVDFLKHVIYCVVVFDNTNINKKENSDIVKFLEINTTHESFDDVLTEQFPDNECNMNDLHEHFMGFFCLHFDEKKRKSLLFVNFTGNDVLENINTIAHEVTHAVIGLCENYNIVDEETKAYLTGRFTESIIEKSNLLDKQ